MPWADWEEWEGVRTGIFSEDLTLRRAAVDRVNPHPYNSFLVQFCLENYSFFRRSFPSDRAIDLSNHSTPAFVNCGRSPSETTFILFESVHSCPSAYYLGYLQVNAWEARGKLPLGAEITACLHELRMRDQGLSSTAGMADQPRSEPESLLRLQYAMLVIRLVNGISDSSQKGRVAMSVANLAEDAGEYLLSSRKHLRRLCDDHQSCWGNHVL